MKSVCRLGAVEFGFKVFSFQFHPGKFMSPPMINIALFIVLALVTDVSKFLITPYQESQTMTSHTQNLTSDQSSHNKNHGPSLYTTKLTDME
jgi:hypothetical protein